MRETIWNDGCQPYAASRADVAAWAENGDTTAAMWLEDFPHAILFGIDDDEIQAWFTTPERAKAWMDDMMRYKD